MMITSTQGHDGRWYLVGPDSNGVKVVAEPGAYYATEEEADDAAGVWNANERAEMIAEIQAANLVCPEQCTDWILDAVEKGGMEAGREELAKAIANNPVEARRLGI